MWSEEHVDKGKIRSSRRRTLDTKNQGIVEGNQRRVRAGKAESLVRKPIAPEVVDFFKTERTPARASLLHWESAFENFLKKRQKAHMTDGLRDDLHRALMTKKIAVDRLIKVVADPMRSDHSALVSEPDKLHAKLTSALDEIKKQVELETTRKAAEEQAKKTGARLPPVKTWIAQAANNLMGRKIFVDGESLKAMRLHMEEGNLHYIFGPKANKK